MRVHQNAASAFLRLVGIQLGISDPCMVIDSDKQYFPACTTATVTVISSSAMPGLFDAPELFRVDVDQVARSLVLITLHRFGRLKVASPCQAGSGQHPAHGRLRQRQILGDARLRHALLAQLHDGQCLCCIDGTWAAGRARRAVGQCSTPVGQVATNPFSNCSSADAIQMGCLSSRHATFDNVFDHFDSTDEGQSGILMDVHSVGFLENWGVGDFQFLKSNPNEPEQPIETSQLARILHTVGCLAQLRTARRLVLARFTFQQKC